MRGTTEERFWPKVDKSAGPEACWIWTAAGTPQGYGSIWHNGKLHRAHRVSLELAGRPCPPGLVVDHLCHNPPCVNPDHLEPVTVAENKRRDGPWLLAARTHCPHGHEWTVENTLWSQMKKGGQQRQCRTCRAATNRRIRRERRARANDSLFG